MNDGRKEIRMEGKKDRKKERGVRKMNMRTNRYIMKACGLAASTKKASIFTLQ